MLQKPAKWANRIDLTRYRSTAVKALFFSINTCHLGKVVIFLLNTSAKILESRFLSTAVASSAHHSKQKKAKQALIRLDYRCDKILHYELCFLDDGHDCGALFLFMSLSRASEGMEAKKKRSHPRRLGNSKKNAIPNPKALRETRSWSSQNMTDVTTNHIYNVYTYTNTLT